MFVDPVPRIHVSGSEGSRLGYRHVEFICGCCGEHKYLGSIMRPSQQKNWRQVIDTDTWVVNFRYQRPKKQRYRTVREAVQAIIDHHGYPPLIFRNI